MKGTLALALVAGSLLASTASYAKTVDVTVDGTAQPWLYSTTPGGLNYDYQYGINDGTGPTVVSSGYDFTAGGSFTISYVSGKTSPFGGVPYVDAEGDTSLPENDGGGSTGQGFPSKYMSPYPIYLAELVGTFADASGQIVGTPFAIGDGPLTITAPTGAQELLLGINDDRFGDNTGALIVEVAGPSLTGVPLPASAPMFGAALAALGVAGYGLKRLKSSAA